MSDAGLQTRITHLAEILVAVNELPFGQAGEGSIVTVTLDAAVPMFPLLSVTVSVTVYVPLEAYGWVGELPRPVVLSPKFQEYPTRVPSGSMLDVPLKVMVCVVTGFPGVRVNIAVG